MIDAKVMRYLVDFKKLAAKKDLLEVAVFVSDSLSNKFGNFHVVQNLHIEQVRTDH